MTIYSDPVWRTIEFDDQAITTDGQLEEWDFLDYENFGLTTEEVISKYIDEDEYDEYTEFYRNCL